MAAGGLALVLLLGTAYWALSDTMVSTAFQSAIAVYRTLTTTRDTTLARDGGRVGVGTAASDPWSKMDVNGNARVRSSLRVNGDASMGSATLGGVTITRWPPGAGVSNPIRQRWSAPTEAQGWAYASASCMPDEWLIACTGFYNYTCWGNWACSYNGSWPIGNTCRSMAYDYAVDGWALYAVATCMKK